MRKEEDGTRLDPDLAFSMDRTDESYNLVKGLSATLDLILKLMRKIKIFNFLLVKL